MIKKILKIVSISLLVTAIILGIITLINYYSYVSVLNKLTNPETNLLSKFELQESRDLYLYRTIVMSVWTCYISIITAITTLANFIINKKKRNPQKIR